MALRETDILTGLYTSGFFIAFGARELAFARENGYPVSLINVYVENDGIEIDPERLKRIGERIQKEAGEGSIIGLSGTNEISVLLPGIGVEKAKTIANRIRNKTIPGLSLLSTRSSMPLSIGVSSTSSGIDSIGDLVKSSRNVPATETTD